MKDIKFMEIQRLIKELDFLESDFSYKNEIIKISDYEFEKDVNKIIERNSELKKIWEHINKIEEQGNPINFNSESTEDSKEKIQIDEKVKKVFKEIAKQTHPDKIKNRKLNEIYLTAQKAHDENDLIKLYSICYDLLIEIEIKDNEIEELQKKIKDLKGKIQLIESTYTNQWMKSEEKDRTKIIYEFIKNKINGSF